jgi:hypothetical protein
MAERWCGFCFKDITKMDVAQIFLESGGHYCSVGCREKAIARAESEQDHDKTNHSATGVGMVDEEPVLCEHCGKSTFGLSNRIEINENLFCDARCWDDYVQRMVGIDKEKEEMKQKEAQDKAAARLDFVTEGCPECDRLKKENELLNSYIIDIRSFLYYIRKEEGK